ncbi:amidohydrolase [Clostridium uliginosum]|uniref:5-methylthioadenosine/S-adenosylhomocysteine deaminase n=1 Tax=Clostridium uliginosum TaxID=119641 RepID=A0A1I1HF35_9CLOT|nr:amidohydrolase [Clostridium uliginosum]SFC20083.1 5-methylthioadenosine/S-adenosylhomocysteine deaminase [Clostridium uliginosum]
MLFKNITMIDEKYDVIKNTNIVVEGNKISYIASTVPEEYCGEVYDGKNKVAMPGFFNTHCHVPMTLLRGYGEGLPLERWLNEKIFPFESLLTDEDCYFGTLLGISEMIKSGVVSFTDMYSHLETLIKAIDETGIKANISNSYLKVGENDDYFKHNSYKETELVRKYMKKSNNDRIRADVSIHAEYTSSERLVRQISEYCNSTDMNMHIHLSETEEEQRICKEKYGLTPAEYFLKCGTFKSKTTAAHCVFVEGDDFNILKENGVTVSHCPSSNLKLGSGIAPLKTMLDYGINVTIGTDGAASNNNLNMIEEVNLAALLHKGINKDPLFLGQKDMLNIACLNGATSQGRENCGCIKVGNRADIVIYDFDKPHMQPAFDVLANILYSAQASDICLSMIDGNVVYKDDVFTNIDMEKVYYNVNRIKNEKLALLRLPSDS